MKIMTHEFTRVKEKIIFEFTEDFSYLEKEIGQIINISPVMVEGVASKFAGLYSIKGNVSVTMVFQCSRCLVSYDYHFESDFNEIFVSKEVEMNWDNDGEYDDENVHQLLGDEIDLSKMIEEVLILNVPYIPVCNEECKGLCPSCGNNLNLESCQCTTEKIDPRLADLAKWFSEDDSTE